MSTEIERRFLLTDKKPVGFDPNTGAYLLPVEEIEQGFLEFDPTIRIRHSKYHVSKVRVEDTYELTVKEAVYKLSREEYNIKLTKSQYESLKKDVKGIMVKKVRVHFGKANLTLDYHIGPMKDLFDDYAEIEFKTEEEAKTYNASENDLLGEEITGRQVKTYRSICEGIWKYEKAKERERIL